MNIKLSNRLAAVAGLVLPGKPAADIGTDHGYLPVYLIIEHICPFVVASDRAKAPLESARQLVELLSLNEQISVRLGEGISVLEPGEAATICMAGMGGATIRDVLSAHPEVLAQTERIIMQPMRGAAGLRRFLAQNGFQIVQEDLALDDGFYYEIIAAEPGQMHLTPEEEEFGPCLLAAKHPLLEEYLALKKADLTRLADNLALSRSQEAADRLAQLKGMIEQIDQVMKCL